jgi:SAM-dependent methyltransferase
MNDAKPEESLKQVWVGIEATDYQQHMQNTGQAAANAALTEDWLSALQPTSVLFAGAGPGQMLDYFAAETLARHRSVTFTDFHPRFVEALRLRLQPGQHAEQDDIEDTRLNSSYAAVILVLVLEHVDWRKAIRSFQRWQARHILIVIQENPASISSAVTPGMLVPGTMNVFREEAKPHLIAAAELELSMRQEGFALRGTKAAEVLHGKRMIACSFEAAV